MILTNWSELLRLADHEIRPAATAEDIAACGRDLAAVLPLQLRRLYEVSDGLFDQRGQWFILWPLAELRRRNELDWSVGDRGRTELLGFGDDGVGGRFCVPRDGSPGVFLWNKLVGAPRWLANDLGDFWLGWTSGAVTTLASAA